MRRILRQHLLTDHLLGVARVPRRLGVPEPAASPAPTTGGGKVQLLQTMDESEVRGCTKCDLCRGRNNTVFGEGDPNAAIMFIGEGPGHDEDLQGRPFVGRAGKLLNDMIEKGMGLKREKVYITNVVKCRPPQNRTPQEPEVQACWDYLRRQIAWIHPRVIVTLGGPATKLMLQTRTGITRLRGTWHTYDEGGAAIPVMPTFHPSFVLRSYTPENRRKVWTDLQAVVERAGAGGGGA